jgi:hypothetical protein
VDIEMNELVKQEETQQVSDQAAIMKVIERVAMSPDADIDKLEKMLDMQERIMDKNAEAEFNKAMVAALVEIPSFEESTIGAVTKGGDTKYKYATFEQINKVVKPILAKHDLFMSFTTDFKDGGVYVTAVITHKDGHAKQTTGLFPFDADGQKSNIQAVGSAISYGKRYMQNALLNISTHGEDDDGFASQKKIDVVKIEQLNKGIIMADIDPASLCEYMGVKEVGDIAVQDYAKATQYLKNIIGTQE